MKRENLKIKLAEKCDFEDFLILKSEPDNIYWSGFSKPPKRKNLEIHFLNSIESENRSFYLLFDGSKAIGYLYIDYDHEMCTAEISYGISSKKRGLGLAKFMITNGLLKVESSYKTIIAWIASSNLASIKTAENLGFQKTPECEMRVFEQEADAIEFYKYFKLGDNVHES